MFRKESAVDEARDELTAAETAAFASLRTEIAPDEGFERRVMEALAARGLARRDAGARSVWPKRLTMLGAAAALLAIGVAVGARASGSRPLGAGLPRYVLFL